MDKRERLSKIVKENIVCPSGRAFYYPNISDDVNKKLATYFDPNIDKSSIFSFFDTSVFCTCGYGLILTLTGFYYSDTFIKPYYVNYKDIQLIAVIPDNKERTYTKNATISIYLSDESIVSIGYGDFAKDNLKRLLNLICQEYSLWDDIVSMKPSGQID